MAFSNKKIEKVYCKYKGEHKISEQKVQMAAVTPSSDKCMPTKT